MEQKGNSSGQHTALYRKYRSRSLDEVVSQSQVTDILKRSLAQGKISHAYLLTGPKGVGKTSVARILAHEINGLEYSDSTNLDIIEIDAASNNSVEDVRDLRDRVMIAPIATAKKVYIIDEVHMLSKSAFNALLKTLEEPPAHVVFILATTDVQKLPETIISRTQHFALHSISQDDLAKQLKKIAKGEGIKIDDDALAAIAARGDGSFRNSIGLLDQLSSFADEKSGITRQLVESVLGLAPHELVMGVLESVENHDISAIITQLKTLEQRGIRPTVFADQLMAEIHEHLTEKPHTVQLLDSLLSVASSSQPHLKLLTVLVGTTKPVQPQHKATTVTIPKTHPSSIEAPVIVVSDNDAQKELAAKQDLSEVPESTTISAPEESPRKHSAHTTNIDWPELLSYVKQNLVALHSVLSKCDYEFDGEVLTLYTGRKFNKTKLDEAKYLSQLHESLEHLGLTGLTIVTLAESKLPEDEKLAKIAAMMGGGKEISLDTPAGESA